MASAPSGRGERERRRAVLDKLPGFSHVATTSSVNCKRFLRARISANKHAFFMDDECGRITGRQSCERSLERFIFHKGVSHAPWPEQKHESATKETICWPLTAAAIEFAAARATGSSQCEKKL